MKCACGCGATFRMRKGKMYASAACGTRIRVLRYFDAHRRRTPPRRMCECGCREFQPLTHNHRFATKACRPAITASRAPHPGRMQATTVTLRRCACGCPREFLPKSSAPWQRYATESCRSRTRRAQRQASKTERHPHTALIWQLRRDMDAEGKAGRCLYCERPLGPRRVLICNLDDETGRECARMYGADWKRGRAQARRAKREAASLGSAEHP